MPPSKGTRFCNKCHHHRPLSLFYGYDRRKGYATEDTNQTPDIMRTCSDCRSKRHALHGEEAAPTMSAIPEAAAAASRPRSRRTVARARSDEGSQESERARETAQSSLQGSSAQSTRRTVSRKGKEKVAIHDPDAGSELVPQQESAQELTQGRPSPPEKRRRIGINPRNVNGNLPKRIIRESPPPFKTPAKPPTKTAIQPPTYIIPSDDEIDCQRDKRAETIAKRAVTSSHTSKGRPRARKVVNSDPPDSGEDSPQPAPARKNAANAPPVPEALRTASVTKKRKAEEPILREPPVTSRPRGGIQAGPSSPSSSPSTSAARPTSSATGPSTSAASCSSPTAAPSRPTVAHSVFAQQPTAPTASPAATAPSANTFAPTAPPHTTASFTPPASVLAATAPSNAAGTDTAPVVVQTTTYQSIVTFIQQLKLLAQLLQIGLDELSVERLEDLWFHLRNDWRVDNMNIFLQGYMVASDVTPMEGW